MARSSALPRPPWLLVALVLCAPSCADGGDAGAGATSAAPEAPGHVTSGGRTVERETLVVVEPLRVGPVRDEIVVSAKVATRAPVSVLPNISNLQVTKVFVEAGDAVVQGQVLATLFDLDLRLSAEMADALHDEATGTLAQARLRLEEEAQRVSRAERAAQKTAEDHARLSGLGDLVNRKEIEDARLASENAADDLQLARFAERGADIAVELALIAQRRAEIEAERARTNLEYTKVRAPQSGVVSQRNIAVGELSSMASPMFVVADTSDLVLNLRVPQDNLLKLKRGQPVEVRAVTRAGSLFHGTVRTVNPVLDETTGTVSVVVDLQPDAGLASGLFCEAHIITAAREDALLVSKRAVLYENDQPVLFALGEEGGARKIPFVAGAATPTAVEVLSDLSGARLPADLRVIVVGQENLKDGAPVRVVEEAF